MCYKLPRFRILSTMENNGFSNINCRIKSITIQQIYTERIDRKACKNILFESKYVAFSNSFFHKNGLTSLLSWIKYIPKVVDARIFMLLL